jgi:cell division protein FtsN
MPKDYKNTPKPGAKRKATRTMPSPPGWFWIGGILALGIVIGLYAPRLLGLAQQLKHVAPPIHHSTDLTDNTQTQAKPPEKAQAQDTPHFDFYKLLPKFQVVIPKQDKDVQTDTGKKPIEQPGAYVLQVASFQDYRDADAMKARLALLGLVSHIQQVQIGDGETWNRVRIGPISNLDKLNSARKTLAAHHFKPLLIQVDNK